LVLPVVLRLPIRLLLPLLLLLPRLLLLPVLLLPLLLRLPLLLYMPRSIPGWHDAEKLVQTNLLPTRHTQAAAAVKTVPRRYMGLNA